MGAGRLSGAIIESMTTQQKYSLVVALITCFMSPFMSSALNLCVTSISTEFACGATTVTWVVNAYTLCTAIFCMPVGHLADVKGRKMFLVAGTGIFTLSCLAAVLAPSVEALIAARVGSSIGTAVFLAGSLAIAIASFPSSRRGQIIGYTAAATFIGLSLGPVLGGVIGDLWSWRGIFVIGTAAGAVAFAISLAKIENDATHRRASLDVPGNLLFMCAIALLMVGLTEWGSWGFAWAIVLAGVVLAVLFVVCELRAAHPMMQVRLFRENRMYGLANLASLLAFGSTYAVAYVVAIYLQNVNGIPPAAAGLVMLGQPIIQAIMSPIAGRLSDRRPAHKIAALGATITVFGVAIMMLAGTIMPVWLIVVSLVVIGFGNSFFSSPNNSAILGCVPVGQYSEANAVINTGRGIGQTLSLAMVTVVFGLMVGNAPIAQTDPAILASAIGVAMMVSTVCAIASAVCSILSGRK